jgi:orotate phosphoribosyltransferase
VSTTGRQVKRAAGVLGAAGCTVGLIVLVIDRGGGEYLREAGYWVRSVVGVRPAD